MKKKSVKFPKENQNKNESQKSKKLVNKSTIGLQTKKVNQIYDFKSQDVSLTAQINEA